MNKLWIALALWLAAANVQATDVDSSAMVEAEATARQLIETVRTEKQEQVRVVASNELEELLQKTLEMEGSYAYNFKDLEGISILQAPNKDFRIFSWQLYVDKNDYQYRGFIQKKDGKVYKLDDKSDEMRGVEFSLLKPEKWYGALYYNMQAFEHEGQACYLLFGLDSYGFFNRRKILEVLYFDESGQPMFGKTVLEMKDGRGQLRQVKRMIMEYSATVSVTLNYNKNLQKVVFDHLVYGSPVKGEMPTNVPDGSYSGMEMTKEGFWRYVDKVYKDDPNNVLINATSYESILEQEKEKPKKKKKDIFGRSK